MTKKKTSRCKEKPKSSLTERQKTITRGVLTLMDLSTCPLSFHEVTTNISAGGHEVEDALKWLLERKLIRSKEVSGRRKDTTLIVYMKKE